MKKYFTLFAFFISLTVFSQAPDWAWAKCASGNSISNAVSNATDASGNVYTTGQFSDTIIFGADTLRRAGMFLTKYDTDGNVLWAKDAGGNSFGHAVTTDANGNVYVAGEFRGPSVVFGSVPLINAVNTGNSADAFFVKYDSTGNVVWAKRFGGNGNQGDFIYAANSDAFGNIYLTGQFDSPSITFDTINLIHGSGSQTEMFLVKYDTIGDVIFARHNNGPGNVIPYNAATDVSGNVCITGMFQGSVIFGNDTLPAVSQGAIFFVKYDNSGNELWAKVALGNCNWSTGYAVATDGSGNIIFTGDYTCNSISFDNITLNKTNGSGLYDMFIVKYDVNGNMIWAHNGAISNGMDIGTAVAVDASNDIYVAGLYGGSITFGSNTLLSNTNSNGYWELYLTKYNGNGGIIWARGTSGTGQNNATSVSFDHLQNLFLSGSFMDTVQFDQDSLFHQNNTGMFIAKLDNNVTTAVVNPYGNSNAIISPNPSGGFFSIQIENNVPIENIFITNILGELIYQSEFPNSNQEIDLSFQPNGIYFVNIRSESESVTQKVVIQK